MISQYKGTMPKMAKGVYVHPSAQVIGDVEIGKDSSIWCSAVVRGDMNYIRIGERTNVQDGSIVHVTSRLYPVIIGDDVVIGHRVVVHGSKIGNRCLIGIGAIVLDNVTIEDEVLVAAGSLVPENAKIPSRTLVMGIPAKPKRDLKPDEIKAIIDLAKSYLELKNHYIGQTHK